MSDVRAPIRPATAGKTRPGALHGIAGAPASARRPPSASQQHQKSGLIFAARSVVEAESMAIVDIHRGQRVESGLSVHAQGSAPLWVRSRLSSSSGSRPVTASGATPITPTPPSKPAVLGTNEASNQRGSQSAEAAFRPGPYATAIEQVRQRQQVQRVNAGGTARYPTHAPLSWGLEKAAQRYASDPQPQHGGSAIDCADGQQSPRRRPGSGWVVDQLVARQHRAALEDADIIDSVLSSPGNYLSQLQDGGEDDVETRWRRKKASDDTIEVLRLAQEESVQRRRVEIAADRANDDLRHLRMTEEVAAVRRSTALYQRRALDRQFDAIYDTTVASEQLWWDKISCPWHYGVIQAALNGLLSSLLSRRLDELGPRGPLFKDERTNRAELETWCIEACRDLSTVFYDLFSGIADLEAEQLQAWAPLDAEATVCLLTEPEQRRVVEDDEAAIRIRAESTCSFVARAFVSHGECTEALLWEDGCERELQLGCVLQESYHRRLIDHEENIVGTGIAAVFLPRNRHPEVLEGSGRGDVELAERNGRLLLMLIQQEVVCRLAVACEEQLEASTILVAWVRELPQVCVAESLAIVTQQGMEYALQALPTTAENAGRLVIEAEFFGEWGCIAAECFVLRDDAAIDAEERQRLEVIESSAADAAEAVEGIRRKWQSGQQNDGDNDIGSGTKGTDEAEVATDPSVANNDVLGLTTMFEDAEHANRLLLELEATGGDDFISLVTSLMTGRAALLSSRGSLGCGSHTIREEGALLEPWKLAEEANRLLLEICEQHEVACDALVVLCGADASGIDGIRTVDEPGAVGSGSGFVRSCSVGTHQADAAGEASPPRAASPQEELACALVVQVSESLGFGDLSRSASPERS